MGNHENIYETSQIKVASVATGKDDCYDSAYWIHS